MIDAVDEVYKRLLDDGRNNSMRRQAHCREQIVGVDPSRKCASEPELAHGLLNGDVRRWPVSYGETLTVDVRLWPKADVDTVSRDVCS